VRPTGSQLLAQRPACSQSLLSGVSLVTVPTTSRVIHACGNQQPGSPVIASVGEESRITATRLWSIVKRFFAQAASLIEEGSPALAAKLRRATPHWMRHTHATHALDAGAELTTVRDNLRHSSISTTSMYLHADDARRAKQIAEAFAARDS
jgi:site-specific recombinase XerD